MRWLSDGEVVSASTDSTLRLWDIHSARESRVFRGHVNEKNFVGLAADSEFIACGSETNEVLSQIMLSLLWRIQSPLIIQCCCTGQATANSYRTSLGALWWLKQAMDHTFFTDLGHTPFSCAGDPWQ